MNGLLAEVTSLSAFSSLDMFASRLRLEHHLVSSYFRISFNRACKYSQFHTLTFYNTPRSNYATSSSNVLHHTIKTTKTSGTIQTAIELLTARLSFLSTAHKISSSSQVSVTPVSKSQRARVLYQRKHHVFGHSFETTSSSTSKYSA